MQRALLKKLIRDILHLRGQIVAMALVVACGVASFVSMRSTYDSLLKTQQNYYSEYRFGDVFVHVTRAPESVRAKLGLIPGVAVVQTRVVAEAILNLPNMREPAQGRIVSVPERRDAMLNDIHLVRGSYVAAGHPDEVIVSGAFAQANSFDPGDTIEAVINGRWRRLTIAGVGLSPEYIYEIRGGDIFPDNRRFGIIWMGRDAAGAAFDMEGSFNDVAITLAPGVNEQSVIDEVDRVLAVYGGTGAIGRSDQQSYRFISNEFSQLRTFGLFLPLIFLGVTAFLLHLVLSRLVNTQREQIGLLKAFGYTNYEIGIHFLGLAFAAVLGGIVFGIALGVWMGNGMTTMYAEYFRFPVLEFQLRPILVLYSILITLGSAAIGAVSAIRRAVNLPPAEAMRPEAPATFKTGMLEKTGLKVLLSPANRIIFRNLSRNPIKAALSVFGISAAAALLFTGFYFFDAINRIVEVQFRQAIREDAMITFNTTRPQNARRALASLPGVRRVETFRSVAAKLTFGHRSRRVGLTGVEPDAELHRIVDRRSNVIHVPPSGLVLSRSLADVLDAGLGDDVTIEVLDGSRPVRTVGVTAIVDDMMGMNAYMDLRAVNRLMNEDDVISGAYLSMDADREDDIYARLKQMPAIAGVGLPAAILKSFNDTFAKTIGTFTFVLIIFSGAIVFGVVYNAARIALSERGRELAALRVLGFTRREIALILLGEHALLTVLAIPLGMLFGLLICTTMNNLVDTEMLRLPLVFTIRTYILTALIIIAAAILSGLLVARRLRRLDLIAVLKTRE